MFLTHKNNVIYDYHKISICAIKTRIRFCKIIPVLLCESIFRSAINNFNILYDGK